MGIRLLLGLIVWNMICWVGMKARLVMSI